MIEAYNGDWWIAHFLCDFTRMNHVYTMATKSLTVRTIQDFVALVHRRFDCTVRIIRVDGETSLGNAF